MPDPVPLIQTALFERFGERLEIGDGLAGLDEIARISAHRVHRRYLARDIEPRLLRLLCACALSAPSKSDLQQADILVIRDKRKINAIADLLTEMPWVRETPVFLVFLANGRRLPKISEMRSKPFPNDHLDLLFNATVDAAIVLTTFLRAAEAVGLGCCPISVIRDHAAAISEMLALPEKVIPVAGMCVEVSARHFNGVRIVPSKGIDRDPKQGPADLDWIRQNWVEIIGPEPDAAIGATRAG